MLDHRGPLRLVDRRIQEFRDTAHRLGQGLTEGDWRSAISRAYYAVFHHFRSFLLSNNLDLGRGGQSHFNLYSGLLNCGFPAVSVIGSRIDSLREARVRADYEMGSDAVHLPPRDRRNGTLPGRRQEWPHAGRIQARTLAKRGLVILDSRSGQRMVTEDFAPTTLRRSLTFGVPNSTGTAGGRLVVVPVAFRSRPVRRAHTSVAVSPHTLPWHGPMLTVE